MSKNRSALIDKADLSEIFAAMSGIVYAGVAVRRDVTANPDHPIVVLSRDTAILAYDSREKIARSQHSDIQEKVAGDCLIHLKTSVRQLPDYADIVLTEPTRGRKGGTLGDVCSHIHNILIREELNQGDRAIVPFQRDGAALKKSFRASYLPKKPSTYSDNGATTHKPSHPSL